MKVSEWWSKAAGEVLSVVGGRTSRATYVGGAVWIDGELVEWSPWALEGVVLADGTRALLGRIAGSEAKMLEEWHPRYSAHFAVIHRGRAVSVRGTAIHDPRLRRFTDDKGMALHSALTTDAELLPNRTVRQYSDDGTSVTMYDQGGLRVTETEGTGHISCRYGDGPEVQVHPAVSREIIHAVAYAEMLSAML